MSGRCRGHQVAEGEPKDGGARGALELGEAVELELEHAEAGGTFGEHEAQILAATRAVVAEVEDDDGHARIYVHVVGHGVGRVHIVAVVGVAEGAAADAVAWLRLMPMPHALHVHVVVGDRIAVGHLVVALLALQLIQLGYAPAHVHIAVHAAVEVLDLGYLGRLQVVLIAALAGNGRR